MDIYFYKTSSEVDKPLKDFGTPVAKLLVQGTLRDSANIKNPTIKITTTVDIHGYNYAYIPGFKRLYFISNITVLVTGMYSVTFKEDVLGTFYASYKECYATVIRNENSYDLKLEDGMIPYTTKKDIVTIPFTNLVTNPFDVEYPITNNIRVIIAVINDQPTGRTSPNYGIKGQANLGITNTIPNEAIGNGLSTNYYVCEFSVAVNFLKQVYDDDTLLGFIKHITILPFGFDQADTLYQQTNIRVGDQNVAVTTASGPFCGLHKYDAIVVKIAQFKIDSSTYDNYIYRQGKWQMWLPYVGWVEINFDEIYDKTIGINYVFNFDNGECNVIIRDETNNRIIYNSICQLGCTIGVSSTNLHEWSVQKNAITNDAITQGVISAITGLTGITLMGTGLGFAPGAAMTASAGAMAMQTATGVLNKDAANYKLGYAKLSSGLNGIATPQDVIIKCAISTTEHAIDEAAYKTLYGLPCYKNDYIKNFSGFTLISKVDLKGITTSGNPNVPDMTNQTCCATKDELDELITLLKDGVRL